MYPRTQDSPAASPSPKRFRPLTALVVGIAGLPHAREIVTLAVAAGATILSLLFWRHPQQRASDFAQVWAGARALVHGGDPYLLVGPNRPFAWDFPLLYPLTAVIAAVPLAAFPLHIADALFVGAGAGALAWALTRERLENPQLLVFVSFATMIAVQTSQWSLLLTAAALLPPLGWVLACKPTIGLALWAAYPRRSTALLFAGFMLASIAVLPGWPREWLDAVRTATHVVAPVTRPGGVLVLLAALRWRRPEARLLVALACVPQTPVLYEAVPLFLVPATVGESLALTVLTFAAFFAHQLSGPFASYGDWMSSGSRWILWLVYLPCLAMVLRRPNQPPADTSGSRAA